MRSVVPDHPIFYRPRRRAGRRAAAADLSGANCRRRMTAGVTLEPRSSLQVPRLFLDRSCRTADARSTSHGRGLVRCEAASPVAHGSRLVRSARRCATTDHRERSRNRCGARPTSVRRRSRTLRSAIRDADGSKSSTRSRDRTSYGTDARTPRTAPSAGRAWSVVAEAAIRSGRWRVVLYATKRDPRAREGASSASRSAITSERERVLYVTSAIPYDGRGLARVQARPHTRLLGRLVRRRSSDPQAKGGSRDL